MSHREVKVTIQIKSPVGYSQQDVLLEERSMLISALPSNESTIVQGPCITHETCAATARNSAEVNVRRDLLITSCGSVDSILMLTLPIPTSAVSNYVRVMLTRETGSLVHFTSGIYTLIIVDLERKYLHSVVCNMRAEQPLIRQLIVPYEAPPVGERAFRLGFVVYRQTAGLINLDHQEVTQLQTRSFDEFLTILHAHNLRTAGNSWLELGPEVMAPGPAPAPAA